MDEKQLKNLQTDELDKRLRAELRKDVPDGDFVRQIIYVLEEREKDDPEKITPELQAAWDQYTNKGQGRAKRRKPTARNWVIRGAVAVGVCIALLMVIPQPAQAETIWERIMRLSEEVVEFFSSSDAKHDHAAYEFQSDNEGLCEVYEAVLALGVTEPVVPMWLPDGYELVECTASETVAAQSVYARFVSKNQEAVFNVEVYNKNVWREYHKDETAIIEYEVSGDVYKVMRNNDNLVIIWAKDKLECSLLIDCQEEELLKIINSIYAARDGK